MASMITLIKAIARLRRPSRGQWGQTLLFLLFVLPAFIGALGLAMDVGSFYFQYYRAQEAVDAAALTGATCQWHSCTAGASTVATSDATTNDPTMTLNPNPVAAPFNDPTY